MEEECHEKEKTIQIEHTEYQEGETEIQIEGFSEKEAAELKDILQDFLSSYAEKPEDMSDEEWLRGKLKQELPEKSDEEIDETAKEITQGVKTYDENLASLNQSCSEGIPKEQWLSDTLRDAAVGVNVNQFGEYLAGIDQAISEANDAMRETIMTQQGIVSQNPNLDGFIAEQHHVNTFNVNAALKNSNFRAMRLDRPEGGSFGKNSADIKIYDKNTGQTIHRYQAKVYKTAEQSIKALDPSRYGNQRGLVAKGQAQETIIEKNLPDGSRKSVTDRIGGTDKVDVESDPLSKKQGKQYQENTQSSGRTPDKMSWNRFTTAELTLNIGKQAAMAGVGAAALTTGIGMAAKIVKGEKIDGNQMIETALKTGADAGVKSATAGALKVGIEKGLVPLAKNAPVVSIACVAIENIKVLSRYADGELTGKQTLECMGRNTVAMLAGLKAGGEGALMGAAIGSVFGPVGMAIGGVVGGIVGYMAGSTVGGAIYDAAKEVGKTAVSVVKSAGSMAYSAIRSVGSTISRGISAVCSWF